MKYMVLYMALRASVTHTKIILTSKAFSLLRR